LSGVVHDVYAEKGYDMVEELLESCLNLIHECPCEEGCPSCVGIPMLRPPIHMDPDAGGGFPIPDKEAALVLLHDLLGKDPYIPKPKPVEEQAPVPEAPAEPEAESSTEPEPDAASAGPEGDGPETPRPKKKARRGSRGGRGRKKKTAAAVSNSDGAKPEPEEQPEEPGDWDYVPMSEWGNDVSA
jgi:DEAD/DEAH box helicase domain-containing protein